MENQKPNFLRTAYLVVFCILFISFKDINLLSNLNKILVSAILGGLGALFGGLSYQLIYKQNIYLKYGLLAGFMGIFIVLLINTKKKSPEEQLQDQLEKYFNSNLQSKIDSLICKPIDTNKLKPPKLCPEEYKRLITCDICGYKAVCPDSNYCYNCFSSIFDGKIHKLNEKKNWIISEQLFWFDPNSAMGDINFYEPKTERGFQKDSLWKPSVTEKQVRDSSSYHRK